MSSIQTQTLLNDLSLLTQEIVQGVNKSFKKMSEKQLNWRPNKQTWSLNDIFWHLNAYANNYNKVILDKIENTRFNEPKDNFSSSPLGRSAWKSMKLGNAKNVKRKYRAPKDTDPLCNEALLTDEELDKFVENQHLLLKIIDTSAGLNLRKIKIPLSISKRIRLRLGDCLMFLIYHNERHYHQALNLVNHRGFPKK